ncbi:hypothetical protein ZWY2020_018894 [Hordeum vulgare]|nr:hypothetical protein ZWY2020_018894 [Hordeum vulgare]
MTTYLEVVAPGFTFCPRQKDLTDVYLRRKIAGDPLPGATARFIHEVDVYSAEPEQLTRAYEKAPGTGKGDKPPVWYFFSPVRRQNNARGRAARKPRTIENAIGKHSHSESYAKPVEGGSAVGGYRRYFSYKVKKVLNV